MLYALLVLAVVIIAVALLPTAIVVVWAFLPAVLQIGGSLLLLFAIVVAALLQLGIVSWNGRELGYIAVIGLAALMGGLGLEALQEKLA